MIIFGTRTMHSVRQTGVFHCPRCGQNQHYSHTDVNRWFTLYFIPVIPMGRAGSFVQCRACAGTYSEAVLSYNPQAEMQASMLKLRGLLVLTMLANDHGVTSDETRAICDFYHEATNTPLAEQEVRNDATHAMTGNVKFGSFARQIAPQLAFKGKAMFVRGVYRVLTAKGAPRPDASSVLTELSQAFQLSPQQIQDMVGAAA
jgi:hypothetical protein